MHDLRKTNATSEHDIDVAATPAVFTFLTLKSQQGCAETATAQGKLLPKR